MSSTAREGVRTCMPASAGEAASLVESAMLLRWRAPDLALLLADRAVTAAQDDKLAILRADHLAVFALNRLGRHGEAAHRLFPAIRDADTPPGLRHDLHVELAHCAAALGESTTALDAVSAVLAAGDDVAPVLRGRALVAVAEASVALGRDDLITSALDEADELYREDSGLDRDTALLLRAAVRATDAVRHRRSDAAAEAEAKAREGHELLAGLADPDHDSGEVGARLMLEIALALLDREADDAAMQEVRPLLRRPVRAAAAASVGRLRLALATRVHLAQGRHEPALTLLADAVEGAQRYGVDAVLAECLEGLSHVHEARDEFADALYCMRAARAAEARHRRNVEAARSTLLENFGPMRRAEARLIGQVVALLGNAGTGCTGSDPDPADAEVVETEVVEEEVVQTEVAKEQVAEEQEPSDVQSTQESSRLDPWQSEARHRRGAGTLISVSDLLPGSAVSAGRPGRRRAEKQADGVPAVETAQISNDGADEGSAGRQQDAGRPGTPVLPVLAYPLLVQPPSDTSTRLVSDGAGSVSEDADNFSQTRRDFSASDPPPAPAPRALEWAVDGDPAGEEPPSQMGLGDLLAEALAAYQESRDIHADVRGAGLRGSDGSTAADAEVSHDVPRYRGRGTRWATGLALAPKPIEPTEIKPEEIKPEEIKPEEIKSEEIKPDKEERHTDDPAEAVTNPLLRLPDLTAEPQWGPPASGRLSAAGD